MRRKGSWACGCGLAGWAGARNREFGGWKMQMCGAGDRLVGQGHMSEGSGRAAIASVWFWRLDRLARERLVCYVENLETRLEESGPAAELLQSAMKAVMDTCAIEGRGVCETVDSRGQRNWDQIKVPGLHTSMSMSDLMSHIEHCIPGLPGTGSECQGILEDIAQYLLSDTQLTTSDEKCLMSRVNSLCCLLQKDPATATNSQVNGGTTDRKDDHLNSPTELIPDNNTRIDNNQDTGGDTRDVSSSKQPPEMSRKDSFGELLLHLPRIASLPKFLFNISEEDGDTQPR